MIRSIRYFSPTGEGMPNGCHYQRGGFLVECYRNARNFVTAGMAGYEDGQGGGRGGILVLPCSGPSGLSDLDVDICVKTLWDRSAVGHAFKGTYRDFETGSEFGPQSLTVEIGSSSSGELLNLATRLAHALEQRTLLVKDSYGDKFYLVVR